MSLREWQKNGWIRQHTTSRKEIAGLLAVVERDLAASADPNLDGDWRFTIAYNAALQCASAALKAEGYDVAKGAGAHMRTIESLRLTIKDDGTIVNLLQVFRAKRGGVVYETTGIASKSEIEELRSLALDLRKRVMVQLRTAHPDLLEPQTKASGKHRANGMRGDHGESSA